MINEIIIYLAFFYFFGFNLILLSFGLSFRITKQISIIKKYNNIIRTSREALDNISFKDINGKRNTTSTEKKRILYTRIINGMLLSTSLLTMRPGLKKY